MDSEKESILPLNIQIEQVDQQHKDDYFFCSISAWCFSLSTVWAQNKKTRKFNTVQSNAVDMSHSAHVVLLMVLGEEVLLREGGL